MLSLTDEPILLRLKRNKLAVVENLLLWVMIAFLTIF